MYQQQQNYPPQMGYPANNGGVLFTYLNQTNNYMVYQPEQHPPRRY